MDVEIKQGELYLLVQKEMYSDQVLHKCFYWYTGTFVVDITSHDEKLYLIKLKPQKSEVDLISIIEKIKQDLIDFKLRDIVTRETQAVRELLVAKAFSYYGLVENPTTNISDPVGFNPDKV